MKQLTTRKGYCIRDPYGCYFLTITTVGWIDVFTRRACKDIIIQSLIYCQKKKGLVLNAFVIMPSHIHLIARADIYSGGISGIIRDFKKYTSIEIFRWINQNNKESRRNWMIRLLKEYGNQNPKNVHFQLWQQNNRPKILLHPKFSRQKLGYIHLNPVKDGVVYKAEDYVYSSARNYAGYEDCILDVEFLDFGVEDGYFYI